MTGKPTDRRDPARVAALRASGLARLPDAARERAAAPAALGRCANARGADNALPARRGGRGRRTHAQN